MKRFSALVLLGAFVAVALTACNQFIPAQTLNNPLGLNNQSVSLATVSTSSLSPQAAAHTAVFQGNKSTTIQDADLSSVPGWAKPNGFSTAVNASSVTLQTTAASTFPSSMDVTRTQVTLQLSDPQSGTSVTWNHDTGATSQQLLVLTSSGSCVSTTSCTYTVKPGSDLQGALENVSLNATQTSKLWTIIGSGASTDDVSLDAKVTVTSSSTIPSGTMVITLDNAQGTLTFH